MTDRSHRCVPPGMPRYWPIWQWLPLATQRSWGFPPTAQGQLGFLRAVRAAMASALPASSNGGVLWWERDEHGTYNSLFDAHYVARPALLQGFRDADATRAHEGASAVHERVNESV